ncbi:MAG: serine protease [Lachnospiraceae bacterium]|nr:serine protease [Lachnospiraceae bacterium]
MEDKDMQFIENEEVKQDSPSFMKETIKQKPINKIKLAKRTAITAFSALIFGAVASFSFLVLEPMISNLLYPEEISKVQFEEEEIEISPDEMLSEDALQEDFMQEMEKLASKQTETYLSSDAYMLMYDGMYELAKESNKYMVTVKSTVSEVDWMQDTIEKEKVSSGVVIADNGAEYLILADTAGLASAEIYTVTFSNGVVKEAVLKQKHTPTGIGIFAVRRGSFSANDRRDLAIAKLGNSNTGISVGKPVIAIGRPLGQDNSLLFGMVSSKNNVLSLQDGVFQVVDTNMMDSTGAGGVIIDFNGYVVGLFTDSARKSKTHPYLSAIGISDLKLLIEKLSNGEKIAVCGIKGIDVTKEANEESGVPFGAYITEVSMQSPAMEAGLLNGDIIVEVDGVFINSFSDYKLALLSKTPGEEVKVNFKRFVGNQYVDMSVKIVLAEGN